MSLISKVIRSLINGISQQAPSVRLDNQVEDQLNMIPDIGSGLTRRNPVVLDDIIAHDGSRTYTDEHAMFNFNVNGNTICIGIKPDGSVYRFDENGASDIVEYSDEVKSYLSYTDPTDLKSIETEDKVIILNRGVKVELDLTGYTQLKVAGYAQNDFVPSKSTYMSLDLGGYISGYDYTYWTDAFTDTAYARGDNHPMLGQIVLWNVSKDYGAVYDIYSSGNGFGSITASPKNALFRRVMAQRVSYIDLGGDSLTLTAPDFIMADIGFERGSGHLKTDEMFKFDFLSAYGNVGDYALEVAQAAGTSDNVADIYINGLYDSSIAIDGATYGRWNASEDTLDLSNFTYTKLEDGFEVNQTYSFTYNTEDSGNRYFNIICENDNNLYNDVVALPIRYKEIDTTVDLGHWQAGEVGVASSNAHVFLAEEGATGAIPPTRDRYLSISVGTDTIDAVSYDDVITAVDISDTDGVDDTLLAAIETELIGTRLTDLSDLTFNESSTIRYFIGCPFLVNTFTVGSTNATFLFNFCRQEKNVAGNEFGNINWRSYDTNYGVEYNIEGSLTLEDVESDGGGSGLYHFLRGDLKYTIDTLDGISQYYNFQVKQIAEGTHKRHMVWVTSVINGATYKVFGNSSGTKTQIGTFTAGASDSITSIINDLVSDITTNAAGTDNEFVGLNSVAIFRLSQYDYLEVECDYGGHIKCLTEGADSSQFITDPATLPIKIPITVTDCFGDGTIANGTEPFVARVTDDPNNPSGAYYLQFSNELNAWVETSRYNIKSINSSTLPVTINKDDSDTILVTETDWLQPVAGDSYSNPVPAFLGNYITDFILFNGRLGMSFGNELVFSEAGDILNFYRTTTASYLISDVVSIKLDSSKLGYKPIKNIFTLDNNLMINTGSAQSILAIPTNLDISGAIFAQASSYDLGDEDPISVRRSMYFPIKQSAFSTIKAFTPDNQSGEGYTDNSVTRHCEKLIRGEVVQSIFTNDVYLVRTDDDPKTVYVQHTYVTEGTIIQNAWHRWTFAHNVKYIYAVGEDLKFIFEDTDNSQTIYGSMSLIPQDVTEDTDVQIGYTPYVDFKTEDAVLGALLSDSITVDKSIGSLVTLGDANSVTGVPYTSSFTMSEIVPRRSDEQGQTKLGYSILMIRRMALNLGFSGGLTITVNRTGRDEYVHNYVPSVIGDIIIGREEVTNESARFPVNGRSQDIEVTISTVDGFTPFEARSIEWQGQLITKGGK